MKIILSPAKKMVTDTDSIAPVGMPDFLDKTTKILSWMKSLEKEELKAIWKCNDKIARQNFDRLENMDLYHMLTPAILSYEGIAFQYMAPAVFEDGQFEYIQKHLRILSAFYGSLKPLDGVKPYRLEMQAKLSCDGARDLYAYWGSRLYDALDARDGIILNLASEEYARAIRPYCSPNDRMITVRFGEISDGRVKQKGTFAKMARGEMVRFMAEQQIADLSQLVQFDALGLHYEAALSDDKTMTFVK